MSDPRKTKAEIMEAAERDQAASYDEHARDLVEKWMAEIRAISMERNASSLVRS